MVYHASVESHILRSMAASIIDLFGEAKEPTERHLERLTELVALSPELYFTPDVRFNVDVQSMSYVTLLFGISMEHRSLLALYDRRIHPNRCCI